MVRQSTSLKEPSVRMCGRLLKSCSDREKASRHAQVMSCRSRGSAAAQPAGRSREQGRLLVVSSRAGVRLPDGHLLHADMALGQGGELLAGLVVEVLGQVLGRGVEDGEGLEVVEHLVVDALDYRTQQILEQFEVQ